MTESTIDSLESRIRERESLPLTLTVLAHPELGRLGEQCALRDDGPFSISRVEPRFARPGEIAAPLGDRHVSRKSIRIASAPGGVELTCEHSKALVDNRPLGDEPMHLDEATLERGAMLTIGRHVALLLRRAAPAASAGISGMVGPSPHQQEVEQWIRRFAGSRRPLLIRGPTGTGKELVARAIHAQSPRSDGPWVTVNLAAIPSSAAASQLFGHAPGPSPDAARWPGLFGAADGGSLFLDEIGDIPDELQPLLLRTLDSGEVQVVGGNARRFDVRVIAATHVRLEHAVAFGQLRSALYHRLAGATIRLAPLHERPEDIAAQLRHFALEELQQSGRLDKLEDRKWLSPRAQLQLIRYRWPGNTRELRHVVAALVLDGLEREQVRVDAMLGAGRDPTEDRDMPAQAIDAAAGVGDNGPGDRAGLTASDRTFVEQVDTLIQEHLSDERFSVDALADALHMSPRQLSRRLKTLLDQSPSMLLREARLTRATTLLGDPELDLGVKQVAAQVGYRSVSHFGKVFRDTYGITPAAYAQRAREES